LFLEFTYVMAVGRGKTLGFFFLFLVSRCIRKAIKCLYINLSVYVYGIQHYTYIYIYIYIIYIYAVVLCGCSCWAAVVVHIKNGLTLWLSYFLNPSHQTSIPATLVASQGRESRLVECYIARTVRFKKFNLQEFRT